MAAKTTALHPCECSNWDFDLDVDRDDDYNTGCKATTIRVFAQGHDAKLVGFMVRAELAGHEISRRSGGMLVTYGGAVDAASKISEALAAKAEAQLAAARARANKNKTARTQTKGDKADAIKARQAEAEAELLAKPVIAPREVPVKVTEVTHPAPVVEVVEATTELASIKVGRWHYTARIEANGDATYSNKLGVKKTALAGTYTVL
jgi:hypothetical protein